MSASLWARGNSLKHSKLLSGQVSFHMGASYCCSAGERQCAKTIQPQTRNCGLPQVAALVQPLNSNLITEVSSPAMAVHALFGTQRQHWNHWKLMRLKTNSWPFHTDPLHRGMELSRFSDMSQKVLGALCLGNLCHWFGGMVPVSTASCSQHRGLWWCMQCPAGGAFD